MLQETKRQTAGVAQASWHDFLPEPCRREPFQSFGLFVFYGSPLFPPPLTNLLVRGLYYQATHIPEPLGLDDRQARAAIFALLGKKAESYLAGIPPHERRPNGIPYAAAGRVAKILLEKPGLFLTQISEARWQFAQLTEGNTKQIESASLALISPRTRNADPCQTLTLSPDLSLPAGKEKALTVIFQREAALRVLEAALAYGERARAPLGYLLRRELANEVLGKIPAIAIDDEETARLTSLLCKEAVVEAAPEVLASCASALGQVIEAEIVKRHREEVERANRAQGMLQMKAMAGLAPRNTYASCYCFSSNPKAEEYKFGLNMKQLTEATDALVSLSWRLAPEVHEKAFMVAQGLLAGGKDCLPISIVQRLEESANRDKRRYSIGAEEDLREKRVPLDTFVGETLKPYVGYDGRFAVESAFNEAERCHSIRVRGLGNMSEEMARKLFQEIAFRAALLCPPPLSRTIELCFEAGDSFFTTGLDSENVLNFYYQRGSILNAGYFAQRMGMEIIRQQKTGAIVLKGGEKC